ncbi:MAG TPA: type II toxin-antitoxin system RelE/ParE family toxin [Roseiarcus sp.]|nr:type II toxin-antitoxin system RelE/ParE family toxin [Roseiarcus sp.]
MRLVWSLESAEVAALRAFIAADNPSVAKRGVGRIAEIVETREPIISRAPFLVAYRIHDTAIEILRVLHGARRWPDRL